jgi:hypothetical protein
MTAVSTKHNQEYIISGDFYRECENKNTQAINSVFEAIGE